ncbi:MAG: hypothetical protein M1377_07610 [Deltaproteobacteria bacterium]|nr:hypothetical protein [Deltaproteobacteria bacterium]
MRAIASPRRTTLPSRTRTSATCPPTSAAMTDSRRALTVPAETAVTISSIGPIRAVKTSTGTAGEKRV